jgi:hypothetical protein
MRMCFVCMQKHSQHADASAPQSVTSFIKLHNGQESIKIGFTNQKVSPHAGLTAFAAFLHWHRFKLLLEKSLPRRTSPNATSPADLALGFIIGILSGGKKLAHCAYLRADCLLPSLLGIARFGSQSALSRFFKSFSSARLNSVCFEPLWRWGLERLSSRAGGYTLDLDSTCLLHEDAHQKEGVRSGHTPRGIKRCLHPVLGMIAEAQLVAGFWLRPGNVRSDNNVVAFTEELFARLPSWVRIGLVRADSGFCEETWLQLLEQKRLSYIVVGRLYQPFKALIRATTHWQLTELPGTEVAEEIYQAWGWAHARRVILIRHRTAERPDAGGRCLLQCPGYTYQMLITTLPESVSGLEVWRRYNGRAGCENIIKELDACFALPQLCLKKFYATEAAMSLAVMSYNLCALFQRHVGWQERVTATTLRFRLFTTAGVISRSGGWATIKLAVAEGHQRAWWHRLLERILSAFGNCIAVEQTPPPLTA